MEIKYKNYCAEVKYCWLTKGFYGEVCNIQYGAIIFLTSQKTTLVQTMQQAIEQYLQLQKFR